MIASIAPRPIFRSWHTPVLQRSDATPHDFCLCAADRALIPGELICVIKRHVMMDLPPAALSGDEAKDADGAALGEFGHRLVLAVVRVGAALPPGEDDQVRRHVGHDVLEHGLYPHRSGEHALRERGDACAAANHARDRAVELNEWIVGPDALGELQRPGVEGVIERLERLTW